MWGDQRNLAEKGKGPIVGVQIRDNVFGASRVSRCAVIAPTTSTPTVSGNVYLGGTVVTVRRG